LIDTMRSLLSCLCLTWLLVLAGCGTPPARRLDSPAVQVTGLATAADRYELTLRLVNTNTVPLVVSRSSHTLYLGETRIGRVDDREPIGVPALGGVEHIVKLPAALAAQVREWLAAHPGNVRVLIESALEIALEDDDTVTLKSTGRGLVKAP
jgi:LEA14-like dessication related protein